MAELSPDITLPEWAEEKYRPWWDCHTLGTNWMGFAKIARGDPPKNADATFVVYYDKQKYCT